ncbi:unnamed protein product [Eruca vesicaria subsp. sativa]|uniref:Uncharacterized protein n=1 Tax=Eruca vesicaria subsp. sativa TaxID=29727 RepID=A0ABC8M3L5_ERUVS|nr:unnamed protein product [Eruca vesicaria subsp. sativa]
MMSRKEINLMVLENVPLKKGRRYGIGRTSQDMVRMKMEFDEEQRKHQEMMTELDQDPTIRQAS